LSGKVRVAYSASHPGPKNNRAKNEIVTMKAKQWMTLRQKLISDDRFEENNEGIGV